MDGMTGFEGTAAGGRARPGAPAASRRPLMVADLFAGAGGWSSGAMRAIEAAGRTAELVTVNHWPTAVETHRLNHPAARHFCQDLGSVRPLEAVPGGRLDFLLAAPSCVHHSRARGGRPTSDQQRQDAWHIITWLSDLRISCLIVENVNEFVTWGPIDTRTGRPVKSREGQYFRAWVAAIRAHGFQVQWRSVVCAGNGDATTRERFFLKARSDRRAPRWPAARYSRDGVADLFGNGALRWRGADEVIDWSDRGASIYGRRKPLAHKTLLRLYSGVVRHAWGAAYERRLEGHMEAVGVPGTEVAEVRRRSAAAAPRRGAAFVAMVSRGAGPASDAVARTRGTDEPLRTMHAQGGDFALVAAPFILTQASAGAPRATAEPVATIPGGGAHALIAPYYGTGSGESCRDARMPLATATGLPRFGLAVGARGGGPADAAGGPRLAVVMPVTHAGGRRVAGPGEPLPTITCARRGELGVAVAGGGPFLTTAFGEREGQLPRTHDAAAPLPTACAGGSIALAAHWGEPDDILFRMLRPGELSRATSLCEEGRPYLYAGNLGEVTKQIGNAVPVRTAQALVAAELEP